MSVRVCLVLLIGSQLASTVLGAALVLNEYNGVGSTKYLKTNDYTDGGTEVDKQDTYFATIPGLSNGRVQSNGGNWFEMVVVEDHIDMRGWEIGWVEVGKYENDGSKIWFTPEGGPAPNQGVLTLSNSSVWSDLRVGTILTFSEQQQFRIDTDFVGSNTHFSDIADPLSSPGPYEVVVDLSTDVSFDPSVDDWWIHVSTLDEFSKANPLVTTTTNAIGDGAGNFSTGNNDWQITVWDTLQNEILGSTGEAIWGQGINSREVGKLEADPSATITVDDDGYNDGSSSTFGQPNEWNVDPGDGVPVESFTQDFAALRSWYSPNEFAPADFDEDGNVDGADFLRWQQNYLNNNASHEQGDANNDAVVDGLDLAIWETGYGEPTAGGISAARVVPEPSTLLLGCVFSIGSSFLLTRKKRS